MRALKLPSLSPIHAAAVEIFRAWTEEWNKVLPKELKTFFVGAHEQVALSFEEWDILLTRRARGRALEAVRLNCLTEENLARAAETCQEMCARAGGMSDIVVSLRPQDVLRREIKLPNISRRLIRSAIRYEVERISPLDMNQICFDFSVVRRNRKAKAAYAELRFVKRTLLERLAELCRIMGVSIAAIEMGNAPRQRAWLDFPVDRIAAARFLCRKWSFPLLLALVAVLSASLLVTAYLRNAEVLGQLHATLTSEQEQARRMGALQDENRTVLAKLGVLAREKGAPLQIEVLNEITKALPDGTWLTDFHLLDGNLRLQGFSASAADLPASLQTSQIVGDPQFRSPLTRDNAEGVDRFDIALTLRGAAE